MFRTSFLKHEALCAQLEAWADAQPEHLRLLPLARTEEGRTLWMMEIGRQDLPEGRPAAMVDANMHAVELTGSSCALAVAEDLLALHRGEVPEAFSGLSEAMLQTLREIIVYVCPRVSPDGADAVLDTGRYVRSVPRDKRAETGAPRWVAEDVDGDGLALLMRQEHPAGEYIASDEVPGLMLPRKLEDEGPFYKLYPEGYVANFDGFSVPDPSYLSDNDTDLNRNFPYQWRPEPEQAGAGVLPLSEVESRAIAEFVTERPNIYLWLNLHTFGGVHIRPLGDAPDSEMNPGDRALYRQLEAWADDHLGYPVVSGFKQFCYQPSKPIRGDLSDFAYYQRGCFAWVCELWDLFEQVGLPKQKRFVDRYSFLDREDLVKLGRWDADVNKGRAVRPWIEVEHGQLGKVEVGGLDPRHGLWNAPPEKLPEVCEGLSALFARTAAMAPRVRLEVQKRSLGDEKTELFIRASNIGYLGSYGIPSSQGLPWNATPWLEFHPRSGEVKVPKARQRLPHHLEGWGRGRWGGGEAIYFQRSRGNASEAVAKVVVEGSGELEVCLCGVRFGELSEVVEV